MCFSGALSSVAVCCLILRVQGSKATELTDVTGLGVCGPCDRAKLGFSGSINSWECKCRTKGGLVAAVSCKVTSQRTFPWKL